MNKRNITVTKNARYFILGDKSDSIKQVWLICHGYGHLASYFIKHFRCLENNENLLVAPEGLHRFYLNGASGRVGASWMTKEERQSDIDDYVNFLDGVYKEIISDLSPAVKVNVLGFSQGGATVCRWLANTKHKIDNLILWAAVFPHDIKINPAFYQKTNLFVVLGDQDEYISLESLHGELEKLDNLLIPYGLIKFTGGHEINKTTLLQIAEKLK